MPFTDIIKGLNDLKKLSFEELFKTLKPLPENRWDEVSVNGELNGDVTDHKTGATLSPPEPWVSFEFESDGENHVVKASAVGNNVTVEFDGDVKDKGRFTFKPIVTGGFFSPKLKSSLRFIFQEDGKRTEYRFDGTNWP